MSLRIAVIGAGHLGRIHARLIRELPSVDLVAVVDPIEEHRNQVAADNQTKAAASIDEVIGDIDAAIVAAPTTLHHRLGLQLLSRGVHVLMEKPIAPTKAEADDLVAAAKSHECVLQVGHVERFNPAFTSVSDLLHEPKYIEARRLGSFSFRSIDIGVVLDLMIHDLDIVLKIANSPVAQIQALGTSVITKHEDMAQTRLTFENGCVANLTASRTAINAERSMSVYCPSIYAGIDFAARSVEVITPNTQVADRTMELAAMPADQQANLGEHLFDSILQHRDIPVPECNPLQDEQRDFVHAVVSGQSPQVTGSHGRNAVAVAEQICEAISRHEWNGSAAGPIGPLALPGPTILRAPVPTATHQQRKAG